MKVLRTLPLIIVGVTPLSALSDARVLTQDEIRQFEVRPGVIVWAPVDLGIVAPQTLLIKGERAPEGHRVFGSHARRFGPNELGDESVFTTVGIALDKDRYEMLIRQGFAPKDEWTR